jgi:hypothetical protein
LVCHHPLEFPLDVGELGAEQSLRQAEPVVGLGDLPQHGHLLQSLNPGGEFERQNFLVVLIGSKDIGTFKTI